MSFLTLLIFLHSLTCDLIQITDTEPASEGIYHKYNISVSKFCCPVCWELLKVLNETNKNLEFVVRAHHSNLYPVCLPPWIPDRALEQMIKRFRKKLYEKLCQLPRVVEVLPGPFQVLPTGSHYKSLSLESAGESISSAGSTDTNTIMEDHL